MYGGSKKYIIWEEKMKKVAKRKRIIALLISFVLMTTMVMPSLAFAGTCPITNCRAATSEQYQGTGLYSTSTHVVNKILFFFGGETCTIRDYYRYYATICTQGHVTSSRSEFSYTTHSVNH